LFGNAIFAMSLYLILGAYAILNSV